ncbi:MAG: hypothetical protein WBO23_17625, partial [Burkholderiales bacterium]
MIAKVETRNGLRRLARIRAIAAGALAAGIAYDAGVSVPLVPLAGAVLFLLSTATLAFLRLRHPQPVSEREIFGQLLADAATLTWILYFTGGGAHPLAIGYALLVLYACPMLPSRLVWAFAGVCISGLLALEFFTAPPAAADPTLELLAPRMTFVLLVALAAWFGVRLNDDLRRQQRARASSDAEKEARERYLRGLAELYAETAHEMSTPLTTVALVLEDLRRSETPPPDWKQNIDLLSGEIQICKRALLELSLAANIERVGKPHSVSGKRLLLEVERRFRLQRPTVQFTPSRTRIDDSLALEGDDTLSLALLNLLDSAADASPHSVELRAESSNGALVIHILAGSRATAARERIGT